MRSFRRPKPLFLISFFIPIAVLMAMLVKPLDTIRNGQEITLATIPLDPRDLFYGDYVILDLEIEQVDAELMEKNLKKKIEKNEIVESQTVFVSLEKNKSGIYQAKSVTQDIPNGIYMKGKMAPYIEKWDESREPFVLIEYGIDRFYVEEGTGLGLEQQASKGKILVRAKNKEGYSILTDIQAKE
ncbi:hypothetical protein D0469_05470 [Peribacillus saganii]|uniref:GDYXXLXY domain-containing protein n=1 Tax=Peribacillus saganii TaxID=2303992 RepID=A0A372LS87_9BACI|nr:GDYXXLXY domain-containing protein [Peribacillus saganii]RFU70662.1 hypothetical protein D0469_05470 [Peribacillus saganii]